MKVNIHHNRGCKVLDADKPELTAIAPCSCYKLSIFDWLEGVPDNSKSTDIIEVHFKNTRKGYYLNINKLNLRQGDIVAVEASPGHDIGIVSLTGELVMFQIKKNKINLENNEPKKVYRKAKSADIQKWLEAISLEHYTMIKTREIAENLKLNMKVGDVEYQGDNTKAIFYYIADERVDFRELIKILADEFKIKVEMKQIGARQEAGKIGGIGTCGREFCCSTWITSFVSVSTNAARDQELSLNPQKLAGQCSKLKCCLNYEHDAYIDILKGFPDSTVELVTMEGAAYFQKTDAFRGIMWYSSDRNNAVNLIPVPVERVKFIMEQNKQGIKIDKLLSEEEDTSKPNIKSEVTLDFENPIGQDSITRFDRSGKKKKKKKNRGRNRGQVNAPRATIQ
ncbi:MAG: hypothetical protein HY958_03510 [Bacteroidia bacterium]|nr:hypothetical protein [Bacteroidia bacterium]